MAVDSVPSIDAAPDPLTPPKGRRRFDASLALLGELILTAGVVLGLYVGWQLFYTDVLSGRTQDAALDKIEWAEPVRVPEVKAGTSAGEDQLIPEELKVYSAAGAPVLAEPAEATTFATLHVPRWGYDYVKPVSEGTDRGRVLDELGIGHYTGTAMPGAVGNFSVAGHRTTYGKPFTDIETLQVGDPLVVHTEDAWYVYTVTGTTIQLPTFMAAIAPVPGQLGEQPTAASITLTTCHPRYSAAKRYIVWGELKYWAPTGHGFPSEVVEQK